MSSGFVLCLNTGFLREVVRRLLGGAPAYDDRLDLSDPSQALAWIQAAVYLENRLQTSAEQAPSRTPDLPPAAGAAMIAVMRELARGAMAWVTLWQAIGQAHDPPSMEAARKLIANGGAVRLDICNPSTVSVKGNQLTQARSLIRLPFEETPYVDSFLRELTRRLLERGGARVPDSASLAVSLDPQLPVQARAWAGAARFLSQRIQSTPQQSPGRAPGTRHGAATNPSAHSPLAVAHMLTRRLESLALSADMSPAAADVMKAVIAEVGEMASAMLIDMKERGLDVSRPPRGAPLAITPLAVPTASTAAAAAVGAIAAAAALPPSSPSEDQRATVMMAMRQLTQGTESAFMKWLGSKASVALLDEWNELLLRSLDTPEARAACCRRHFGVYALPADMAGWLLGLCVFAESLPLAFVLSDAATAGFPLVFVNKKFTDVTGYTKEDCSGRNCRFLQGPATNPEHGKQLLDTLRAGRDSQVMLVNYRKNGEVFENLLTMAYIRDCHGRRRYCVGLQLDLTGLAGDDGPWGQVALASDHGRRLIEETRKKYAMLIKLLPQTLQVPEPQRAGSSHLLPAACASEAWYCPQLQRLADGLGVPLPDVNGACPNWISVLYALLNQTTHATAVCDMSVPGLPLDYCNEGFAHLTGYPCEEVIGKNCRFLQDERTEPERLYELITAIRTYANIQLRIRNVTKAGLSFVNDLSTHPIFDTDGKCRFMLAVLADASAAASDGASLGRLREHLPTQPVDASLFPLAPPRFEPIEPLDQWKEFQKANMKLIRLLWATEPDGALRQLLTMPPMMTQQAVKSIVGFLRQGDRAEDEALLAKLLQLQQQGVWDPLAGRKAME